MSLSFCADLNGADWTYMNHERCDWMCKCQIWWKAELHRNIARSAHFFRNASRSNVMRSDFLSHFEEQDWLTDTARAYLCNSGIQQRYSTAEFNSLELGHVVGRGCTGK